jgi:hypothetical protein
MNFAVFAAAYRYVYALLFRLFRSELLGPRKWVIAWTA